MEGLDLANIDGESIILIILSAGLGTLLKDIIVGGLRKVKELVIKSENKVDDKILAVILTAVAEASKPQVTPTKKKKATANAK